jgi:hypothetical protein
VLYFAVVKAPDDFYDEDIESDKVFLDMAAAAMTNNGVKNITTTKVACYSIEITEAIINVIAFRKLLGMNYGKIKNTCMMMLFYLIQNL